eukprot:XP_019858450.1 PREDICTED: uncharacterized protein LOC109586679 [Amphimedon queenslandica]
MAFSKNRKGKACGRTLGFQAGARASKKRERYAMIARFAHLPARLIAERLGLEADTWHVAFQSRVGREEWLRPWTDEVLQEWGKEGVERVDVICPGFAADCLETLEEIALRGRDSFVSNGGGELRYIPALNADKSHIEALGRLVEDAIPDWLATPQDDLGTLAASAERARALGAKN